MARKPSSRTPQTSKSERHTGKRGYSGNGGSGMLLSIPGSSFRALGALLVPLQLPGSCWCQGMEPEPWPRPGPDPTAWVRLPGCHPLCPAALIPWDEGALGARSAALGRWAPVQQQLLGTQHHGRMGAPSPLRASLTMDGLGWIRFQPWGPWAGTLPSSLGCSEPVG